jgi:hypothetical protein
MPERTYTSEHVVKATPWDVYEMLVDQDQQGQWRTRFEPHTPTLEETPYTRIAFEDQLVLELEPQDGGTLLRATRTKSGEGFSGVVGLLFTSRRTMESNMHDQLVRIASTMEFGAI